MKEERIRMIFLQSGRLNGGNNNKRKLQQQQVFGGSPGLVVMGGDSCSKGPGFEAQRRILDTGWTFFTFICCKNCYVCVKRQK